MIVCLFYFSIVYLSQAVNPRISKLTVAAAETCANISWEYEGPEHVNFYVEYGVAGSKKQLHYPVFNLGDTFKEIKNILKDLLWIILKTNLIQVNESDLSKKHCSEPLTYVCYA